MKILYFGDVYARPGRDALKLAMARLVPAHQIDFVIVKGKTEPEAVYAIVGRKEIEATEEFQRMRALLADLLQSYRGRDWEGALQVIERRRQSQEAGALGPLFELYAERIKAFKADPPPDDWNGAYQLLTK